MISDILFEGCPMNCIFDTGSQVTTLSQAYFDTYLANMCGQSGPSKWFKLKGANHLTVHFTGCVELNLNIAVVEIFFIALIVPSDPSEGIP